MAATSQEFDALDGLVITGNLDVGANVTVDTNVLYVDTTNNRVGINKTPTTAFDVNGDVTIDGGTINNLTELTVDNLVLDGNKIKNETAALQLVTETVSASIVLDASNGIIRLRRDTEDYLRITGSSTGAATFATANTVTTAMQLQPDGDVKFYANTIHSDGQTIHFGSVMDITASSSGATFSANTYHAGYIVHDGDTDSHLYFNALNEFTLTLGGNAVLQANSTTVDIGTLIASATVSETTIFETVQTEATYNIDINDGSAVICTATCGGTVAFTMPSTKPTDAFAWTVKFNNSGTITWPASVEWAEGVTPPVSTGTDIYSFVTYDGGTTIYGSLAVRNAS